MYVCMSLLTQLKLCTYYITSIIDEHITSVNGNQGPTPSLSLYCHSLLECVHEPRVPGRTAQRTIDWWLSASLQMGRWWQLQRQILEQ